MAGIQCFLYALCLAKHLEPMSRAGWAKCRTVFFKRTAEHALMPNPQEKKELNLTTESATETNPQLTVTKWTNVDRKGKD